MVIFFTDGSKVLHSYKAKVSADKSKNELYVEDKGEEFIYHLDVVHSVELEKLMR